MEIRLSDIQTLGQDPGKRDRIILSWAVASESTRSIMDDD